MSNGFLNSIAKSHIGASGSSTSKQVGDPDHHKVFADADAAEAWFAENDPEGVAFEYEVIEPPV